MRRSRRYRGRAARRPVTWETVFAGGTPTSISADGAFFQAVTWAIAQPDEITITRTRGEILIYADGGAVGDSCDLAFGIGLIPSTSAGLSAVPLPYTDAGWDGWLWHQFSGAFDINPASQLHGFRIPIDSKAMRKWETNEQAAIFVCEMANESGAMTVEVIYNARMLFKV